MNPDSIDAALATIGHKTAQGGVGITFVGWALSSEGTAVIGILMGLVGLSIQWYYRRKQDRREEEQDRREAAEHEARMKAMQ
jgi:hypothetical protein